MTTGAKTIIYPVTDLDAAKQLYGELLATKPHTDEPYYVGYRIDDQEVGLDPNGHDRGMTGPVAYWHVDDVETALESATKRGGVVSQPVRDVGGGRRIATITDADGNPVGLLQDA